MKSANTKNNRSALILGGVVFGMVGMAYAAVPLYEIFCQVTGYGGTTQIADNANVVAIDRDMKIRFTANLNSQMPWDFSPVQNGQEIKVGERAMAYYEAFNPTKKRITGTAVFNVTPFKAGEYFSKIECFCFTEQTLEPGERVQMPVTYFVDPAIADDPNLDDVTEIVLSYTFYLADVEDSETAAKTAHSNNEN